MLKKGDVFCIRCGKTWYGPMSGVRYCTDCKKIIVAERGRERYAKEKEEKIKTRRNRVREITRLADAEGLSYGKYCLKHGI